MKYIFSLFSLLSTALSCMPEYIIPQDNTPFLQMSKSCFIDSNKNYTCSDIDNYIYYDPDIDSDLKKICKYSKVNNFTNSDFADLINYRFKAYGFSSCNIKTINNLENKQLKDQCQTIYTDHCCSVHVV